VPLVIYRPYVGVTCLVKRYNRQLRIRLHTLDYSSTRHRTTLMRHGYPELELCYPHPEMLTEVVVDWDGIVLIDSTPNVILLWLPRSGIIQNKSWLLKSPMAHARHVKVLKVSWWGITHFNYSITHDIGMLICSFRRRPTLIFCTLLMLTQSTTSCHNTLCTLCIHFCSQIDCISCFKVQLQTYCTGCSNTWKLEMSMNNQTIHP